MKNHVKEKICLLNSFLVFSLIFLCNIYLIATANTFPFKHQIFKKKNYNIIINDLIFKFLYYHYINSNMIKQTDLQKF